MKTKVNCFQCHQLFFSKTYIQKNNWDYWTGKKTKQKICDGCLHHLYYDKLNYWSAVTNRQKRNLLRSYVLRWSRSAQINQNKAKGENGFPKPKQVNCSQCQTIFFIKFVIPHQAYSQKNNFGHWTEKVIDEKKEWCNKCLLTLYHHKPLYWKTVTNLRKRQLMSKYVYVGKFSTC